MRVPGFAAVVAAAAVLVAGAGTLVVAHGGDPTLIHSCVKDNGEVRIVSAGAVCKKEEIALDWNITGPIGATGPKGADGAPGRDGRDGIQGLQGPAGTSGGSSGGPNEIVVGQVSLTGSGGPITGGDGAATFIDVRSFSTDVKAPTDLATGQATGKRQYAPIKVTKQIDAATPLLHSALSNNQVLSTVVLKVYRSTTTGADFTITLTSAKITEITDSDSGTGGALPLEDVFFTFRTIEYQFSFGTTTRTYLDSPFLAP